MTSTRSSSRAPIGSKDPTRISISAAGPASGRAAAEVSVRRTASSGETVQQLGLSAFVEQPDDVAPGRRLRAAWPPTRRAVLHRHTLRGQDGGQWCGGSAASTRSAASSACHASRLSTPAGIRGDVCRTTSRGMGLRPSSAADLRRGEPGEVGALTAQTGEGGLASPDTGSESEPDAITTSPSSHRP